MYGKDTWVNARAMRAPGMSYVEIGSALGIDRRTANKLCLMEDTPEPAARERSSIIDPYKEVTQGEDRGLVDNRCGLGGVRRRSCRACLRFR